MALSPVSSRLPARAGRNLITVAVIALLAACGGGGGNGSSAGAGGGGGAGAGAGSGSGGGQPSNPGGGTPVAASSYTFSGTAATGAAFAGGVVTVIDASGTVVGTSGTLGADGQYTVTVAATAKAPFVIVAARSSASGETEKLVSVSAGPGNQTINVTPVTTLIAARLSASGNPENLAAELASGTAALTAGKLQDKIQEIQGVLAPLLSAAGVGSVNPLSDAFSVNGAGYDRLLDSLLVSITPASDTSSNIEVGVRQQVSSSGAAPISVRFSSNDSALPPLPSAATYALVEEGTAARIAALLDSLTACYALPTTQRVSSPVSNGVATGDASAVAATACKVAFLGGNPAAYLSNGSRVGRNDSNNGAFAGLFRDNSTGLRFLQGSYEYTRANGDIVVAYKQIDTQGSEFNDTIVVRKDTDGKLRLIGNQYGYSGGVSPFHQLRMFPTLNQSAYSYLSTGYTLVVNNETEQVNGQTLLKFDHVEVATPFGTTLTLWPNANYSTLNFKRANGSVSGSNVIKLGAEFLTANATVQSPAAGIDPGMYFASPLFTDAALAGYATQSTWTFRYFLRGNSGTSPDAVQTYRTRARALTIGELKKQKFATLNQAFQQTAFGASAGIPTTGPVPGSVPLYNAVTGPQKALISVQGADAWTMPTGTLPPTTVSVFGNYAPQSSVLFSFNDTARVGSWTRSAVVPCSPPATGGKGQCADTTSGNYGQGAYMSGLQLTSIASNGRQFATHYGTYKLSLPN